MNDDVPSRAHRFRVGDRVRVLAENPRGNPRVPTYVRGRAGRVVALHGIVENPLDHRDAYAPLCTVVFDLAELSGVATGDEVAVDLHEEWLERVP